MDRPRDMTGAELNGDYEITVVEEQLDWSESSSEEKGSITIFKELSRANIEQLNEEKRVASSGNLSSASSASRSNFEASQYVHRKFGRENSVSFMKVSDALEDYSDGVGSQSGSVTSESPRGQSEKDGKTKANRKALFPQFQELERLESVRRELLFRTRQTNSFIIMSTYYGTVFQSTIKSVQLWFSLLLYITLRILHRTEVVDIRSFPPADLTYTAVMGSFLSFFLVFFASESYSRYKIQYDISMRCQSDIFDIVTRVRMCVPFNVSMAVTRYLNTAHTLAYCGVSATYNSKNLFLPINSIYKLLTDEELERVLDIGIDPTGTAYREVLAWTCEVLRDQVVQSVVSERIAENTIKIILNLRKELTRLYEYADQPIPFFYLHLVFFISLLYIPVFAYTVAVAVQDSVSQEDAVEIVGLLVIFMNGLFILGIRESGYQFADPYGSDPLALSVMHYVTYTAQMTRRLLGAAPGVESDDFIEDAMDAVRPKLHDTFSKNKGNYKPPPVFKK